MEESTTRLWCPICGGVLELPAKGRVVFAQKTCPACGNAFLVVMTAYGKLIITADLKH